MTSTPPNGESEQQWQQPAFQAPDRSGEPVSGNVVYPPPPSQVVRRPPAAPPSVAESVVGTLAGLVWPVMIVIAIMGVIGWWPAIIIAIITSAVLGNVRTQLRWRRRAITRARDADPGRDEELR